MYTETLRVKTTSTSPTLLFPHFLYESRSRGYSGLDHAHTLASPASVSQQPGLYIHQLGVTELRYTPAQRQGRAAVVARRGAVHGGSRTRMRVRSGRLRRLRRLRYQ